MTFDPHMTFDLDTEVKNKYSYKRLFLLQITGDDDMSWSCDLTLVGAYRCHLNKGSKVIKGSFPVLC